MIRKTVFWVHLGCGVAAALVILMMSVTGVILTYERQMLDWAEPRASSDEGERLPVASLVAAAQLSGTDFEPASVSISSDPGEAVAVSGGPGGVRYVDPYTGVVLGPGPERLDRFFGAVTGWHRWFNATGEDRAIWRAITGASNLIFLFLIVSGLYLWLPRVFRWPMFRARLKFVPLSVPAKARDFNWHHVFGIWTALPLIVVVATAAVFYYPWANALVYRTFGEEPPAGRRGPAAAGPTAAQTTPDTQPGIEPDIDALLAVAAAQVGGWRTITVQLPNAGDELVRFTVDQGNGGQPQRRHSLTLGAASGDVTAWQPFQSQTPGRRARSWVRFLHTGEALGWIGQTVAGIVSLTSVIMVWTGLALAWRRLIVPLFRRPET